MVSGPKFIVTTTGVENKREFGGILHKNRIEYGSSVDALAATSKRLRILENKYGLSSEEFYHKYSKGLLEDSAEFIEWANDYQLYVSPAVKELSGIIPPEADTTECINEYHSYLQDKYKCS